MPVTHFKTVGKGNKGVVKLCNAKKKKIIILVEYLTANGVNWQQHGTASFRSKDRPGSPL